MKHLHQELVGFVPAACRKANHCTVYAVAASAMTCNPPQSNDHSALQLVTIGISSKTSRELVKIVHGLWKVKV